MILGFATFFRVMRMQLKMSREKTIAAEMTVGWLDEALFGCLAIKILNLLQSLQTWRRSTGATCPVSSHKALGHNAVLCPILTVSNEATLVSRFSAEIVRMSSRWRIEGTPGPCLYAKSCIFLRRTGPVSPPSLSVSHSGSRPGWRN